MKRIFISSVQREFANVRKLLKRYVSKDPALRCAFDTFVFEEDVVSAIALKWDTAMFTNLRMIH